MTLALPLVNHAAVHEIFHGHNLGGVQAVGPRR